MPRGYLISSLGALFELSSQLANGRDISPFLTPFEDGVIRQHRLGLLLPRNSTG